MNEKKPPRRKSVKNPALNKKYNSRIRQEYIDQDYLHKLSEEELKYLNDFMSEWNNAAVGKQSEAEKNKFHKTAKEVKDCTDRNNKRNSDEYGVAKARNLVHKLDYETLKEFIENSENKLNYNYVEDAMIDLLDDVKQLKKGINNTKK